jgi:hypothetical protein
MAPVIAFVVATSRSLAGVGQVDRDGRRERRRDRSPALDERRLEAHALDHDPGRGGGDERPSARRHVDRSGGERRLRDRAPVAEARDADMSVRVRDRHQLAVLVGEDRARLRARDGVHRPRRDARRPRERNDLVNDEKKDTEDAGDDDEPAAGHDEARGAIQQEAPGRRAPARS